MNKLRAFYNFFLHDLSSIFPQVFIFYLGCLILSSSWDFIKNYFNWTAFHVIIFSLGVLYFVHRTQTPNQKQKFKNQIIQNKQPNKKSAPLLNYKLIINKSKRIGQTIENRGKSTYQTLGQRLLLFIQAIPINLFHFIKTIFIKVLGFIKFILSKTLELLIHLIISIFHLKKQSILDYIKITIIVSILCFAIYKQLALIDFLMLVYAVRVIVAGINFKVSIVITFLFLLCSIGALVMKKVEVADIFVQYVYYFLAISVVSQLSSFLQTERKPAPEL